MKSENITIPFWLLHLRTDLPQNSQNFMKNGDQADLLFRLLHQGDLSTSIAWHSIWHASERTPLLTPCSPG